MIRKLTADDNTSVMEFLCRERAFNLFIIGDIENFGYESDFQELWAEFDGKNKPKAVLLRYYHYYGLYAVGNYNAQEFADIIMRDTEAVMLSGKQPILDEIATCFPTAQRRELEFAELDNALLLPFVPEHHVVSKATVDDIDAVFRLYGVIDEFTSTPSSTKAFRNNMESGSARTFGYRMGSDFLALASTAAENSLSAMVVGVCTHPHHRRKGYATLCLVALCRELLAEGRTLCLFYDNPEAGTIYHRIGFKNIGKWITLTF